MNRFSLGLRHDWVKLSAVVLFLLAVQAFAAAQCLAAEGGGGRFIFILDGSGSMNGQIQGKAKIDMAKETLIGLIGEIPEGVKVGLVAYGHRRKGDCSDVEELSPLAPVNKVDLTRKVKSIGARGMTPITSSVQQVAEGLRGSGEDTTIVLVSDGEETCKGDPCALVRELRASGIRFVLHVIGFDVTEKQKEQLACLARAGDGSYFTARNASELKLAARKAVEEKKPAPGELTVRAVKDGKPFRAFCVITRAEGDEAAKEKVDESWLDGGRKVYPLPLGIYDVSVENREGPATPPVLFSGVLLEPGSKVEKVADFSGGVLTIRALRNGVPTRAWCTVSKSSGEAPGEKVTEGWAHTDTGGFKLPPGAYEAVVVDRQDVNGTSVKVQGIDVAAGKTVEKVVEFAGGTIRVKALRNDKPLRAYVMITKAGEPAEEEEKQKVAEGWTEPDGKTFDVIPGAYDVVVEDQEDAGKPTKSFDAVAIEAGKTEERIADFSGGTLRVLAKRNGEPFSAFCRVLKAGEGGGGGKERVAQGWTRTEGAVLRLEPGVYDLVVENQDDAGKPVLNFNGIVLEGGKTVEKVAEFNGGTLKVKATRNGKSLNAMCFVFAAGSEKDRKQLTRGWTREDGATFQLLPGSYDVVVEDSSDASKPRVELKAVAIEAGKTLEQVAEFSGGTLVVKAMRNGKPINAMSFVFNEGNEKERKQLTREWTRDAGATFQLPSGSYDVVVEDPSDASKPRVELKAVAVEPGKTVERVAEFSGGTLVVKATRNGKPINAMSFVFTEGSEKDRKQVTREWTRDAGATFQLPSGSYNVVVEDPSDASKPRVELKAVAVEAGKTVERVAEFSGGTLVIKATRNGKTINAMSFVFTEGSEKDRKQVTREWTRDAGATFKLPPGSYDVVVENQTDANKPKVELKAVAVEAGKATEKVVEFSGGDLQVRALRGGKPFSALCTVFTEGSEKDRKQVTRSQTREEGASFQLVPGTYTLVVEDSKTREKKEIKDVTVEAGKSRPIDVAF